MKTVNEMPFELGGSPRLPPNWKVARVRDHVSLTAGFPFPSDGFTAGEGMPLIRIRDLNNGQTVINFNGAYPSSAVVHQGDLIVGMDGDFNIAKWRGGDALLNQRMCRLRAKSTLIDDFLFYLLSTPLKTINDLTYYTTVKHLSNSDILNIKFGLPPVPEQRAIAEYLDRETEKIDALISKQEELIERIEEKQKAFTAHAATNGLDPDCSRVDSGIEWIGFVPSHWPVMPVKRVAKLESGHTPSKSTPEYWIDCQIPWVSLNDTKQLAKVDYITDTAEQVSELGLANSSAHLLPKRAVVFTRDATVGLAAITTRPMAVSQHLIAWICGDRIIPEYLLRVIYAMKGELGRSADLGIPLNREF